MPKALIFGGSGQIGTAIADKLKHAGWSVVIPTRHKAACKENQNQVCIPFSFLQEDLERQMAGVDLVVNCIGILAPKGDNSFEAIHTNLPRQLAQCAARCGVKHFIHISALGADTASASSYARSKAAGEKAVQEFFPDAIIFRPSIVFGPRDSFFNRFASMARFSPFLPLIGGGHSRFQPVYVEDVAVAVLKVLEMPSAKGKIFILGGPTIYSFKELMIFILRVMGIKRFLLPIPWWVAQLQATVLEKLPGQILTRDQLILLRSDNIIPEHALGLSDLGITPQPIEKIVPYYLRNRA